MAGNDNKDDQELETPDPDEVEQDIDHVFERWDGLDDKSSPDDRERG